MSKAFTPDHARVMRNTALLYFRMALMMCINLYTSRIVLLALGIEDYGVFYVVWGLVEVFSFINYCMTSSTQRFLTFELGTGNKKRLNEVFITSVHIHFFTSIIIILLSETGGLWFLTEKMVIPEGRQNAAMWCFQLSVITAAADVMSYPYQSVLIAREKMSTYAYISIFDAVLKLVIVGMLLLTDYDRLIVYAILYTCEKLLMRLIYKYYCTRHYEECRYRRFYDKSLFKKMSSFAGWAMMGSLAHMLNSQGLNLLLNVFFGPVANAARTAASQAQNAIGQFARNFQVAINPQITKSYASGQLEEMHILIYRSSRLTFCLLLILCLPVIIEAPMILGLWLKEVPQGTVDFLRLLLVILLVHQSSNSLSAAIYATGKIKIYQTISGGLMISVVPVAYIVLKMGGAPWSVFIVYLFFTIIDFIANVYIVLPKIHLKLKNYFYNILKPCIAVLMLSLVTPIVIKQLTGSGMLFSLLNIIITVANTSIICYSIGIDQEMRSLIKKN